MHSGSPPSGLDPAGRDALLNLVRELGTDHGKSVVLSTHLLADVQAVCERVVILAGGRVRGQGTVEELCSVRQDRYRLRVLGDAGRFRDASPAGARSTGRGAGVSALRGAGARSAAVTGSTGATNR